MSAIHVLFVILILVLLSGSVYAAARVALKKKTFINRQLLWAEISIAACLFCCLLITMSINARISLVFYSGMYIAIDMYLYLLLRFANAYTDYGTCQPVMKDVFFYLCIIDIVLILLNFKTNSYIKLNGIESGGDYYIVSSPTSVFMYHRCLTAFMLIASIVIFMIRLTQSTKLYKVKYGMITLVLMSIIGVDIICSVYGEFFTWNGIILAASSLWIVYSVVSYAPRRLLSVVLDMVADDIADGIILFDEDGQLYFSNKRAKKLFGLMEIDIARDQAYFDNWLEESGRKKTDHENIYTVEYRENIYRIQRRSLTDQKRLIGIYYMIQDLTEENRRLNEANYKARYDVLTDIYNEKYFAEVVAAALKKKPQKKYALICTDVNQFKLINDLFGIDKGNQVLKSIVSRLHKAFGVEAVYGRVGADRFAVFLPMERVSEEAVEQISHSLTEEFDEPSFSLVVYMGIYEIKDVNVPVPVMCNHALLAVESMKGSYIKRTAVYGGELSAATYREGKYTAELTKAIEKDEIKVFLQPQSDRDGKVIGAEALVRWQHPEDGLLSPFYFVPALEKNGRITELDKYVWRQACELLRDWKKTGRDDLYISVNISAKDCYLIDIYEVFSGLVKEYDINPGNLKLEITESAIVNNLERQIALVERLQSFGFVLEMDDFGSAYSSFNMLKDINMDVLKIDMKFLENSENMEKSRTILKSIVALAAAIDMNTVAEGVETEEQFEFLREVGCEAFQGYYFSKPLAADVFVRKYVEA